MSATATAQADIRKAPPGKFRIIYTDPRGHEPTIHEDCSSLSEVSRQLRHMLSAERASMSVYDEHGEQLTDLT